MLQIKEFRKQALIILVAVFQIVGITSFAFTPYVSASETPAPSTEASVTYAPCPSVSGTSKPTGSAAHTFVLNPSTCNYENSYYSWSPVTKNYTTLYDQTPTLNASGTALEYPEWVFSPASGSYVMRIISVPVPQPTPQQDPSQNNTGTSTNNTPGAPGISGNSSSTQGGNSISNTGPNSTNSTQNNTTNNSNLSTSNNTLVLTDMSSTAISGDAFVLQNTNGGNATSGDATVMANFLNMIQSGWSPQSGNINTFNAGLYGNFTGDLLLNPDKIVNTGSGSTNSTQNNTTNNLTVNSVDNSEIINNIDLNATSGDANVSNNTNAGNATSGDATATANLINMINSQINGKSSFIGMLDIYGNLNGDILLPYSLMAMLSNTGPNSTNSISNNTSTNIDANIARNYVINNNFDLNATSGDANVSNNTNAGNATSGDATTSAKQQNYVGVNGAGTKGILVFVNNAGNWTGMILNNPTNSLIASTGPNSINTIENSTNNNIDINLEQNYTITNNIKVSAQSGNANVSNNTNAGNATSGDASSNVNVLNMIDSNLNFTDWFGVLFINVFGTWNGSFGNDTDAGNPQVEKPNQTKPNSINGDTSNLSGQTSSPTTSTKTRISTTISNIVSSPNSDIESSATSSISTTASSDGVNQFNDTPAGNVASASTSTSSLLGWLIVGLVMLGFVTALNYGRIMAFISRVR